jgi:hypothetical protein
MLNIERQFELIWGSGRHPGIYKVPTYKVGSNQLMFFYDGLLCIKGIDFQYTEVGENGSLSNEIDVYFPLLKKGEVTIIVISSTD